MPQWLPGRRAQAATRLAVVAGVALLSGPPALVAPRSTAIAMASQASPTEASVLRRMVAACTVSMANNVCSVANATLSGGTTPRASPAVFVVGAGSIDRGAYADLQAGGKRMCEHAESACRTEWSGPVCTTARSLWSD